MTIKKFSQAINQFLYRHTSNRYMCLYTDHLQTVKLKMGWGWGKEIAIFLSSFIVRNNLLYLPLAHLSFLNMLILSHGKLRNQIIMLN
jgi:hypothetical protein